MSAFYTCCSPTQLSAVEPLRDYARQLVATEFERLVTDAGILRDVREGPRFFARACLAQWGKPSIFFKDGSHALENAILTGTILSGPRDFPHLGSHDFRDWTVGCLDEYEDSGDLDFDPETS